MGSLGARCSLKSFGARAFQQPWGVGQVWTALSGLADGRAGLVRWLDVAIKSHRPLLHFLANFA